MKKIVLCLALPLIAFKAYGSELEYEFNNSNQQTVIERAVFSEVIAQTKNTKCFGEVNLSRPETEFLNNYRHVNVNIRFHKDKKVIAIINQKVNYSNFGNFKYLVYNIVNLQCK